jgi:RHS repeat-associated protein
LALVSVYSLHAFAQANAGVSDERVNLPEAPGSIDGVGENASAEGNQGALRYSVQVDVPEGFPGVTPDLSFSYSSASGSDVLGIGWSMPSFSIERMTAKGLQKYDLEDRFAVEGSEELLRVSASGTSAVYRARFEAGFVRYTWRDRGTGEGGYWTAEFPDGRVGYYGADTGGVAVPAAQVVVPTTSRVFRWHLVALVDRFGHALNLQWTKDPGGASLLDRMEYLYEAGQPRHSVRFTYQDRSDVVSDARPGFDMRLTKRLQDVRIFSGTEMVRSYVITYEMDALSGGATRIARVQRFGRGGVAYPVQFNFGYSRTLGTTCDGSCLKPFVRDMGALPGADFSTGRATLIDMNGDALPDVVLSTSNGVHSFFYARLDMDGRTSFTATATPSTRTTGSSPFILGTPAVQVIDVNGDGFTDIVQPKVPAILCNNGSGDWADSSVCASSAPGVGSYVPEDDSDSAQVDPKFVRFFDYDNDKRIDWLRTYPGGTTTEVLVNDPAGFTPVTVSSIGVAFDESTLQLADMNGDGLQDPVQLLPSGSAVQVQYKLNLGYGRWSANWSTITLTGLDPSQIAQAELQDINGDSLADVVAVLSNEVKLAINRNGDRFDAVRTIAAADLEAGALPTRGTGTVVSYADMNGNGSDDIVWIQPNGGAVSYLELFPVRPNLIARIDNGIGAVQRISYGTSIAEQARDVAAGKPWLNKVPNPMTVVTAMENFVTLTGSDGNGTMAPSGLRERQSLRYHSGFYDGVEKQFRGYEGVERELQADMSRDAQEPGLVIESWDVGKPDSMNNQRPLFAGLKLKNEIYAYPGGVPALIREERSTFEACPVDGAPMSAFVCERATTAVIVERDPSKAVTLRTERDFDGFGNVTRLRELGVINLGTPENPQPCAACTSSGTFGEACGATCLGDENYDEDDYVVPGTNTGNLWVLNLPRREASGAVAGMMSEETLTYYDGNDFEGLPLGQLTRGSVTRVTRKSGPGATDVVVADRYKRDAHGNVLEELNANGTVGDMTKQRRVYTYEPAGLHLTSAEVRLGGANASAIRQDITTETAFELVSQSSNWYPVNGSMPLQAPQLTRYRYDEHGRMVRQLEPGDTDATPSEEYEYTLADPASRILLKSRSSQSSGNDIVTAICLDGRGRAFQRRLKVTDTRWHVDGFVEFDSQGAIVRQFFPYDSTSGNCDMAPPANVPSTRYLYDAVGRVLSETEADGSVRKNEYGPLVTRKYDEDDSDAQSNRHNTPEIETVDGLGRLTSLSRLLQSSGTGTPAVTRFGYDALGMMSVVRDANGNVRTQTYNPLGLATRLDDTNGGTTTLVYDGNGNEIERTDARGVTVKQEFDSANRITARFDAANEAATKVTWTYDRLVGCAECTNTGGLLVSTSWPGATAGGEDRFGYDSEGNVLFTQRTIAGKAFISRRAYDQDDREVRVVYPGGVTIETGYDGAGRVKSVSGAVTSVDYTERGEVGTVTFANGAVTTYGYDDRLRLTSLKTKGADGSDLLSLGFTRTRSGDLTELNDGALPGRVRHGGTFTLDAWSRVTKAVLPNAAGSETLDFTFDAIDNLTNAVSSLGNQSRAHVGDLGYGQNKPNAVTTVGSLAVTYDAAGGILTRGGITLTRDHLGRIITADGPLSATFTYDEQERVAKEEGESTTWYIDDDFEIRDGISVVYARLGDNRVTRLESDSLAATVLSDLAPATGTGTLTPTGDDTIDIADAWLAQGASTSVLTLSGGPSPSAVGALLRSAARRLLIDDATWLHADHLNSVVLATNEAGAPKGERSFYPTGTVREEKGYVDQDGFTGQEFDEATGMIHFRFRELDPRSGRWDRPDPAFDELDDGNVRLVGQSTVGYAYVANAFTGAYDPTGLTKKSVSGKGVSKTGAKSGGSKSGKGGSTSKAQGKGKDAKGGGKKGASAGDKIARVVQVLSAVTSAVLSIAGAAMSAQSTTFNDSAGQAGSNLSLAAASFGGLGTLVGAGIDTKSTFSSSNSSGKSGGSGGSGKAKKASSNSGSKNVAPTAKSTTTANKGGGRPRSSGGTPPKPVVTKQKSTVQTREHNKWRGGAPNTSSPAKITTTPRPSK